MSVEAYKKLTRRLVEWATEQEGVKPGKVPTPEQQDAISDRLAQAVNYAKIFHWDMSRHPRQSYFMRAKAPIVVAHTGNKWGKTFALLARGLVATLGCAPWDPENSAIYNPLNIEPPVRVILIVQDLVTSLPLDIMPRIKELIPWDAFVTRVSRVQGQVVDAIEFFNGSQWKILSHVQEDERFEGWSAHLLLWNEPMPRSKFIGACRGAIEFNAPHIMSFTPISEPWLYDEIYLPSHRIVDESSFLDSFAKRPEKIVVEGTIYDNPFLDKDAISRYEGQIPESQRLARIFGGWSHLAGRIYKRFSRTTHVRELHQIVATESGTQAPESRREVHGEVATA